MQDNLIRAAAGALGGTIGDLAERLATSPRTVYGWSRGEAVPPPATQILLALIAGGVVRREHLAGEAGPDTEVKNAVPTA